MDVNSVMSTYNMSSLWNSLNSNSSNTSTVPLTDNVDSSVQEQYTSMNYFSGSTSTELQDIFKQVEPTYGIPLTYNQSGDLSIPTNTTPPTNGLAPSEENIVSLLQSNNSAGDTIDGNILSQYDSIENGTFQANFSSILSSNPYNMYSSINSITSASEQNVGSFLNSSVWYIKY